MVYFASVVPILPVLGPTVGVLYGVLCHGLKQSGWLLYRIGLLYQLSPDLHNSQRSYDLMPHAH